MWETQVQSLDWEDPLEKGMATHSSILAWRMPWTEGPVWLQFLGLQKVRHDGVHFTFAFYFLDQEMPYNWKKFFLDNLLAVWPEIFNKLLWVSVSFLMFLIKKKKKKKIRNSAALLKASKLTIRQPAWDPVLYEHEKVESFITPLLW